MFASDPLLALAVESRRLATVLAGLAPAAWETPTRCAPWDVKALAAHITMTLARLGPMLDAPAPETATVDAPGYYRPDERFSQTVNDIRIDSATSAAGDGGRAIAARFATTSLAALERCAAEPAGRLVTTRHGDPMTLTDFLTTRVVEVAVHGIDLADAIGRPHWTSPEATAVVTELLLGPGHEHALAGFGMDPVDFIAKATGRDAFTDDQRAVAEAHGLTWLSLG